MPFDVAGNFTRTQNFQQDRDNGIKILAARVDNEFDNFATGMNAVFFRDGRVPMQGDLRMNINRVTGLADGSVGSPALKFNSDASTGPYLAGLSQYAIAVNGVQRALLNTAGMVVTGDLSATTGSIGGNVIATLAGGTFTGGLNAPTFTTLGAGGGVYLAPRDATVGTPVLYSPTQHKIALYANGGDRLTVTDQNLVATIGTQASVFIGAGAGSERFRVDSAGARVFGNGSTGTFTVQDNGGNGANLVFAGNGATTPNKTMRALNGNLEFINSAYNAVIAQLNDNGNFSINGSMFTVNQGKWQAQHDGADAYVRANTGNMYLGGGGGNVLKVQSDGSVYNVHPTGMYANQGGGGTYGQGYSQIRSGLVGYHMYNQGASCEWLMYQPAPGTSHEFRIGSAVAGSITDRFKIGADGQAYFPSNHVNINGNCNLYCGDVISSRASSPATGAIFLGNSGTRYLYWDNTQFYINGPLQVAGNITSSSDARLKSNVRPYEDAMQKVLALQPKRFVYNGREDFGFIAQEVQPVFPEAVLADAKGMLSIDYGRLTAPLAAAIKALNDRLDRAGL